MGCAVSRKGCGMASICNDDHVRHAIEQTEILRRESLTDQAPCIEVHNMILEERDSLAICRSPSGRIEISIDSIGPLTRYVATMFSSPKIVSPIPLSPQ